MKYIGVLYIVNFKRICVISVHIFRDFNPKFLTIFLITVTILGNSVIVFISEDKVGLLKALMVPAFVLNFR